MQIICNKSGQIWPENKYTMVYCQIISEIIFILVATFERLWRVRKCTVSHLSTEEWMEHICILILATDLHENVWRAVKRVTITFAVQFLCFFLF